MSESQNNLSSIKLSEMLPVGMLAHAGLIGLAMAAVAQRKYAKAGWEAFHYERISESEFEITGGMLVLAGGAKKWPGPHESVIISEDEILQQMALGAQSEAELEAELIALQPEPSAAISSAGAKSSAKGQAAYLNLQLALPDDEAGRERILRTFHLQANFFGATVLSCSLSDKKL